MVQQQIKMISYTKSPIDIVHDIIHRKLELIMLRPKSFQYPASTSPCNEYNQSVSFSYIRGINNWYADFNKHVQIITVLLFMYPLQKNYTTMWLGSKRLNQQDAI